VNASKPWRVAALWAILTLSSLAMLGLFWRFPLPTCLGSIACLAVLLRIVRFARLMDSGTDSEDGEDVLLEEGTPGSGVPSL
jgi:hypothetical protein